MHMLEEHVVPFIRKRKFPLGFFGEQGGESIHHDFVSLAETFSRVASYRSAEEDAWRALHCLKPFKQRNFANKANKKPKEETSKSGRSNLNIIIFYNLASLAQETKRIGF